MKHKVQDKLTALEAQVEAISASEMLDEFKSDLLRQFKVRKDQIEDWQDVDKELAKLKNRLRVIADKDAWTVNNIKDMALICAIIWNNK